MTRFIDKVPKFDPEAANDETVLQAGVGLLPYAGPILVGVMQNASNKRAAKEQHTFNVNVARGLDRLNDHLDEHARIVLDDLIGSDEFLAALSRLGREAVESGNANHRRRLAAATAQSGDWSRFASSQRQQFARLVLRTDDLHVFLLQYFLNPRDWLSAHGLGEKWADEWSGAPLDPFKDVLGPDQSDWGAPVRQALDDMDRDGLLSEGFDPDKGLGDESYLDPATSPKGRDFLEYIDECASSDAEPAAV